MADVGAFIRARRKKLGYTQAELAERTGMNRSMLSKLESKEYTPSIHQLQALGEVLGFEPIDLFIDKEKQAVLFNQIKEEMNAIGLKSKDMKKFIEYGWMLSIPDVKDIKDFKLNFRDGLETLAGLHQYSQIYMTSSEILHSTPLLIYSNKKYFYYLTILNLYESFFRIEEVFRNLFFLRVGDDGKQKYLEMRKMYYAQLINIHTREMAVFKKIKQGK